MVLNLVFLFFFYFLAMPHCTWGLSSLTRDRNCTLSSGSIPATGLPGKYLNHWPLTLPSPHYLNTKQNYTKKNHCSLLMFRAAIFTRAQRWKQVQRPLTDKWIRNVWYVHTMEYYSAFKKVILMQVTAWMDLEGIMLGEIASRQNTNTAWFH